MIPAHLQKHIHLVGSSTALCGYHLTKEPDAGDAPDRREQKMTDCAECWEAWRALEV